MPGNDIGEQMAEVSLNEGLHQKSGQLLGLGKFYPFKFLLNIRTNGFELNSKCFLFLILLY